MPANVGEMFYYGEVPWHRSGTEVAAPLTVEEALEKGGLDWRVGAARLQTCDEPPSPARHRKAIVRLDRRPGHPGRALGVVYPGFRPVQNRDGAMIFDAIFGQGKPVYHTGGYLGHGEVVWLMAKIDHPIEVASGDLVEPYALFANSHDGSQALSISLTTVRVVCQNTLSLALKEKGFGAQFRRAHQSSTRGHAEAAGAFFAETMQQLNEAAAVFKQLAGKRCREKQFEAVLDALFPIPEKPRTADRGSAVQKGYETRLANVRETRAAIAVLREAGLGEGFASARGTFWGALSAVTEYVDHHHKGKSGLVSYTLLGQGMNLKRRAYKLVRDMAAQSA